MRLQRPRAKHLVCDLATIITDVGVNGVVVQPLQACRGCVLFPDFNPERRGTVFGVTCKPLQSAPSIDLIDHQLLELGHGRVLRAEELKNTHDDPYATVMPK